MTREGRDRDPDYADGFRHAYHGDAPDPDRSRNGRYRDGARDGRLTRADEEQRAVYGDEVQREGTQP